MINVTAPVNSLGFGLCGLNVLLELERAGWEPAWWPIGQVEAPVEHQAILREMRNRTNFYKRSYPSLRLWHPFDLAHHVGSRRAAYTMFELTRLKSYEKHNLKQQDQVFVPTQWASDVLNSELGDLCFVAPLGVDQRILPDPEPARPDQPTTFINVGKWEVRKGHDVIVEAFSKAFTSKDNVRLIMACHNPCFRTQDELQRYNQEWTDLYKNSPMGQKITILPHRLESQQDVFRLMVEADCGVFPARGEGWNLELAEMLAMGKHCIATNYSGHTEFVDMGNCFLIEIDELEDAHDGVWFNASDVDWDGKPGQWAKLGCNQMDKLIDHLQFVHELKQLGQLTINENGRESMKKFTWENTAKIIVGALC